MLTRAALASGLLFAVSGVLLATPVTYSVSGTFSDSATVSGAIIFDNATGAVVSFHVVTQYNVGDGLGETYDSSTGAALVQYPTSPPPVSGTYFTILLTDAGQHNALNLILAGFPTAFIGGTTVQSLPVQMGGSLLTLEENLVTFNRRAPNPPGIVLAPPPASVPALTLPGMLIAMVLLALAGCYSSSRPLPFSPKS